MRSITRTPIFWILFVVCAFVSVFLVYHYFHLAFPIVQLKITMDRTQALHDARQRAHQYGWGPHDFYQAASFETDELVKTFVELEGGGKDAFAAMIRDNLYEPYTWKVRHFKEFEPNETIIYFTPEGHPYGLMEIISENVPGAQLDMADARRIAEQEVINNWHIKLTEFVLIESSKEIRPSERIDYTFVYERSAIKIGEGLYRLRLTISGDRLTEVTHFVKVPEQFILRYQEMRSSNELISDIARTIIYLIYIIGCCTVGLFICIRQRLLLWRPSFIAALIVALVGLCSNINQIPLIWMHYSTALSIYNFFIRNIISITYHFFYEFLLLNLIFMAAESLTRKAFGNHIQLWRLWTRTTACSWQVIGRTVGGYFVVPLFFAFITLFYITTTRLWGWWIPSESRYDPNILATYLPWLQSIAISLHAGFMEECLFRAVPLACAALIGSYYNRRTLWITGAFIVQAIIFGAAHANYPMQPAYARLVELFIPSCMFGGMYLLFGLLPAILAHFTFDVVWTALPLFISMTPGIWINQGMIIILTLIPLIIVGYSCIKNSIGCQLPIDMYNAAWKPLSEAKQQPASAKTIPTIISLPRSTIMGIIIIGVCGLFLWVITTSFTQDALPFTIQRTQAITSAENALTQKIQSDQRWYPLTMFFDTYNYNQSSSFQHKFIWQEGGKNLYHQLLGTYLAPTQWLTRFVRFEGSVTERAESFYVFMKKPDHPHRIAHQLPEVQPGAHLSEGQARTIAHNALSTIFNVDPTALKEIAATPQQLPARIDWLFVFADLRNYPLTQGQPRINIEISGDTVTDYYRYIYVPETWARNQQNKEHMLTMIMQLCGSLVYIIFIIGAALVIAQLINGYSMAAVMQIFTLFFVLFIFDISNALPAIIAQFTPSQPFYHQVFQFFSSSTIKALVKSIGLALTCVYVTTHTIAHHIKYISVAFILGTCIGCGIMSIYAAIAYLLPSLTPTWAVYAPLKNFFPIYAGVSNTVLNFVSLTLLVLLFVIFSNYVTRYGKRYLPAFFVCCLIFGFILASTQTIEVLSSWLILGTALGSCIFIAYLIVRLDYRIVIPSVATHSTLSILQQGIFNAFSGAIIITIASISIIWIITWYWFKKITD